GQFGRSVYGSDTAPVRLPAKSPRPEPSTTAIGGNSAIRLRTASAAALTSSKKPMTSASRELQDCRIAGLQKAKGLRNAPFPLSFLQSCNPVILQSQDSQ